MACSACQKRKKAAQRAANARKSTGTGSGSASRSTQQFPKRIPGIKSTPRRPRVKYGS